MTEPKECLFCNIVGGGTGADVVHQDEAVTVFRDINPQAPVHMLLVPNEHVATLNDLTPAQDAMIGRLVRTAAEVAAGQGIGQDGYRLVTNCGRHGGQVVMHVHVHLLGGREMAWPPG
jgi:histidine triad (HIT) family protein